VDERTGDVLKSRLRRRNYRGAAAVEFALIMIPLLTLVMGLVQYGWYFYVAQNTSGATTTLARKLEVGDCWASGSPLTFAQAQSREVTAATTSPAGPSIPAVGTTYTVTVTANGKIIGFLPMPNNGVVTRTVTAQVEDTTPSSC
jgi:Flp pilus assembly protein TadG